MTPAKEQPSDARDSNAQERDDDTNDNTDAQELAADTPTDDVAAWEEIEAGRFMPRRIRGSFRGRALG